MYLGKEVIHNIFWCGGMDSTYLVCKRVIIEKKPIQTYYLNFPCDGYYPPYPLGRNSREVEVKVMEKLRKKIIKQFPYTESLFPRTILVEEFPINKEVYKKLRFLHEEYNHRYRLIDQQLYMVQYSLHKNKIFEYAIEIETGQPDWQGGEINVNINLIVENLTDTFKISNKKIPELKVLKNIIVPLMKTYRKDMVEQSRKYNFTNILENTWSCRWPKSNGDVCGRIEENFLCNHYEYIAWGKQPDNGLKDGVIRYYKGDKYETLKRKTNYNDILND
jgi:hypothetical protein